jgi:hypothetical protein
MEAFSEYPHIANSHADKFLSKCRSVVPADAHAVPDAQIMLFELGDSKVTHCRQQESDMI